MGRYYWDKKDAAEDCLVLDIGEFARRGCLKPGLIGTSHWSRGEVQTGSIGWTSTPDGLRVFYSSTSRSTGVATEHNYTIRIERTPAGFGGERACFCCPDCASGVRKLYLPPNGTRFLCRSCHDLSYRSRQAKRDPWGRAWDKVNAIERQLETKQMPLRTRLRLYEEMDAQLDRVRAYDPLPALLARTDRRIKESERPRRGPGRQSKRELRERLQAERARQRESLPAKPRPLGRPREKRPYVRRASLRVSPPPGRPWAFCVRCRDRRPLKRPRPAVFANGRSAVRGTCVQCGTRMARIVGTG